MWDRANESPAHGVGQGEPKPRPWGRARQTKAPPMGLTMKGRADNNNLRIRILGTKVYITLELNFYVSNLSYVVNTVPARSHRETVSKKKNQKVLQSHCMLKLGV